ncbi:MAG: S8 family serine peptidase, partial [Candidatus Electryonea clarkiae]|nr:S8 family serine peptidase [Candidatus Electryonea clarkiae]
STSLAFYGDNTDQDLKSQWRENFDIMNEAGVITAKSGGNRRGSAIPYQQVSTPSGSPSPWRHPDEIEEGGRGGIISCGAVESDSGYANYSSDGPTTWEDAPDYNDYIWNDGNDVGMIFPDVSAPAGNGYTLSNSSDTGFRNDFSGTSMATPHVAGVITLMLSKNIDLEPEDVDMILQTTAYDLGDEGKDNDYGAGLVQADEALLAIDEPGEPDATVSGIIFNTFTEEPVEGAIIYVGVPRDTTDEDGYYELNNVHSGDKTVRIRRPHYYYFSEEMTIDPGDSEIDFEITPLATLSGIIYDSETEEPVEGAVIAWKSYSDTTDAIGAYSLVDIRTSTDTLIIEAEHYFDYEDNEYEIPDGYNEEDFAIDVLSGDLTGTVIDEFTEEPLLGALVTVIDSRTGLSYREIETIETGEYLAPALHDGVRYLVAVTLDSYAPSDTEQVNIRWNRENTRDFELIPIFERNIEYLQTEQPLETWVLTAGIVTQGSNITDTAHTDIYFQDSTGWGIQLWDEEPRDTANNINRGDEISVTGFLVDENDITKIIEFELEVVGIGNPMPEPRTGTTFEMAQNDEREGAWGQISGQINRTPPGEGRYSLIVDDGSGQCAVLIIDHTGIDLTGMVEGDWGLFTGVIGVSRQGVRIIPNMQQDIELIEINPPTELTAETTEQADPVGLEVTLTWIHDNSLDAFRNYGIFRDGEYIDQSQDTTWSEVLEVPDDWGEYSWTYYVTAVYYEGETEASNEVEVTWYFTTVFERLWSGIPTEWALEAIYPNPFNPTLSAVIALPDRSELQISIYNIVGQQVAVLANGIYEAGYQKFAYDGINMTSGIYFLHATVPGKLDEVRKIVLMK